MIFRGTDAADAVLTFVGVDAHIDPQPTVCKRSSPPAHTGA